MSENNIQPLNYQHNEIRTQEQNGGRPGWWEGEAGILKLAQLKQAFSFGCTDLEACVYADISESQLYYYQEKYPDFISEKQRLKEKVVLQARKNVVDRIMQEDKKNAVDGIMGGADNSWKYLEKKKKKEFGNAFDVTTGDEPINKVVVEIVTGNKYATQSKDDDGVSEEPRE